MPASPSLPYLAPFAVFIALLAGMPLLGLPQRLELALWLVVVGGVIIVCSRGVLDFTVTRWAGSLALGVAVFAIWIAPDLLFPGYRQTALFDNALVSAGTTTQAMEDPLAIALRAARAAIIVPIAEELFWRAWLPRWLVARDFRAVPLGTYTTFTFAATALLFALEHGHYWDVGLAAGIAYNAWMWRTRSLGDCILAHAVTNACLAAYVVSAKQWQYW